MSKKTEGHSSALSALRFVERRLMNDCDLPYERCRHVVHDLESIYDAFAQLWADELEYVSTTHVEGADQLDKPGNRAP